MNTLFRNFSHTFRRFFTASVLNLLGLSIAFAACFVILTQVDYDYNYNKAYPAHDRIYRVEVMQAEITAGKSGWLVLSVSWWELLLHTYRPFQLLHCQTLSMILR